MPKFTQAIDVCLKKTMLARVPDCYFTPEDVALITKETDLEPAVIQNWAKCLRWRMGNNFFGRGIASAEEYLKASEESLAEKVSNVVMLCHPCPLSRF
jgi:hypothetical protein